MGKHRGKHRMATVFEKGIAIREWTGRPGYYVVDFQIAGRRVRKAFSSLGEAKAYCNAKRTEVKNKGTESLDLTERVRRDALAAMKVLEGTGLTILEAAQDYVRRHPKTTGETVSQTCKRYLDNMEANGRRPLSIYEKRLKFNALSDAMGEMSTAAVEESDIRAWADTLSVNNRTKEAYVGAGMSLLAFFRGKLKSRGSVDQAPPVTWDANMVANVFKKAEESVPAIIPALTVLFFAGVRPYEMMRLNWDDIDTATRVIRLTGEQTKTRTMRNVDLSDNAVAWLTAYTGSGLLVPSRQKYRDLQLVLMSACGITKWPVDVARHTFATMHYNAHQNAASTMAQLGHFGNPQTFVTHYKGVPVSAADVKAFWSIRPERTGGQHTL